MPLVARVVLVSGSVKNTVVVIVGVTIIAAVIVHLVIDPKYD